MKSYQLLADQLADTLRQLKLQRAEGLKDIKGLYAELEGKQGRPFEQVVERIGKNLQFFKDSEYKNTLASIHPKDVLHKHSTNLLKINQEISKLDTIIKNGCGSIVEKPPTSRLKSEASLLDPKELSSIGQQQSGLSPDSKS